MKNKDNSKRNNIK